MSDKRILESKLAQLEFTHDQLLTELAYMNRLMVAVGFTDGLSTVKGVAEQLLEEKQYEEEN